MAGQLWNACTYQERWCELYDINEYVGITSTPVIDLASRTLSIASQKRSKGDRTRNACTRSTLRLGKKNSVGRF